MKLVFSVFPIILIVACSLASVTGQGSLLEALGKRDEVRPVISSIAYATRTRRQATTPTFTQPVRYMIPSGSASVLTCTNSDSVLAVQRASFQFPSPINVVQFQGNNLLGPQAMTVGGSLSTAFTAAPQSTAYPVAATFDFNTIIPSSFQPSIVRNAIFMPGIPPVLNITNEDSVGHDRNDLTCFITNAVPPFKPASECTTGGGLQCCQMVVPASVRR
ncbi:hypothetical protein GALMADRAFT_229976 [Galerina marginata CBS 339.88]|uniref:Hydrophobin n=1 Tax=Galerina marginata (strain CBS 339.88) TaxID=685588 RepID=A0A067SV65_GALM3|nr:hypothetical protein GALMADRAFT_229976 [Galerina marginata CBS 339.88]